MRFPTIKHFILLLGLLVSTTWCAASSTLLIDQNAPWGWDFRNNPINIHKTYSNNYYVDYNNESQLQLLDKLSIHAQWYDYPCWLILPIGPIFVGLYNSVNYNYMY